MSKEPHEILERLLMEAPMYDPDTRLVATDDLIKLRQLIGSSYCLSCGSEWIEYPEPKETR